MPFCIIVENWTIEDTSYFFVFIEKDHYTYLFGCTYRYSWIDGRRMVWPQKIV